MSPNLKIMAALTKDDARLYEKVLGTVEFLIEPPLFEVAPMFRDNPPKWRLYYTSHSFCRAFSACRPELETVDGYYYDAHINLSRETFLEDRSCGIIHSWLITPDRTIIDVCPPGFVNKSPVAVPSSWGAYRTYAGTYVPFPEVTHQIMGRKLLRQTAILQKEVEEMIECPFF